MQTTINWTNPINWLTAVVLLTLLVGQGWLIARNQSITNGRKGLRAGLNLLLWLVLAGYFLQLHWPIAQPSNHALLVADDLPAAFARRVKDSLHIQESFTSRTLKPDYDSITLVGQNFPTETLTQLSHSAIQWIPYNQPDQLQTIRWKGIVRQGETQRVTGRVWSSKNQMLRLRFGRQTLDSTALHEGNNAFDLQFPAFAQGRSQIELALGQTTLRGNSLGTTPLDTIRFFTRRTEPLTVQFILNNPDFESKTLGDWLGKQGHMVQLSATLSKQISSNVRINTTGTRTKITPDLIITEPTNANTLAIRKAIAEGKSVLFINLTSPETDSRAINQAAGSRWQVRKVSNEPLIPAGNGLNALSYRFVDNLNQLAIPGYPVAVQQTQRGFGGRVGISLLSETYPLILSGDSVTYSRVWSSILARLTRPNRNIIQVNAPLFSTVPQPLYVNSFTPRLRLMPVGQDTVSFNSSPINDRSAKATSSFSKPGWQSVQDSLAVYVDAANPADPLAGRQLVHQFMLAHQKYQTMTEQAARKATAQVPNWVWLILIVFCFTALWVEPKLY